MKQDFNEFMATTKNLNRWHVSLIFMSGMFSGICLAVVFLFSAVLV